MSAKGNFVSIAFAKTTMTAMIRMDSALSAKEYASAQDVLVIK